ncbi:hypothetical protein [Streptomyces sp. NPDC051572]|uniref:hypothetical protein n=1 Tax=Streptomyces sp. NPDC051572 TaxID=3155802 RepID=UPI00344B3005
MRSATTSCGTKSVECPHVSEDITPEVQAAYGAFPWKSVEQGAAASALLAACRGISGRYFEDCDEAETTTDLALHMVGGSMRL